MKNKIEKILKEKFGHSTFRPGQQEAIESILTGQDTLVMLPTGTGKSLCYQLPAYMENGATLIISPLLSLMQDQVESLKLQGEKRVIALNSMTPYTERGRILKQMNQYRFIYTSPEMLQNKEVMSALKRVNIRLFVVDEAHCISHWGTDFRPDYLVLSDVRRQLNNPPTMALTATATKRVRQEIIQFLGLNIEQTNQIVQSVDRPEIKYIVEHCSGDKIDKILYYIHHLKAPGIIYFMSKSLADETAQLLREVHHIKAESYHSDIEADDKIKIQQQFLQNKFQIVCATSAFGMGFDKKDIRLIVHYHLPASPEMYLQEVGRAGRDGKESLAVLLYQNGDEQIQRRFLEESLPTKEILQYAQKNKLENLFGEEPLVKLAHYFLRIDRNINHALETITERKEIKNKQLNYMLHYVYHKACKREVLLNYFNESRNKPIEECCSSCGLNEKELFSKINHFFAFDYEGQSKLLSWEDKFEKLYHNK